MSDDLKIKLSDQVKDQVEKHPELKEILGELFANFHQAADGVKRGQYKSFDDAMEFITGQRPKKVDLDDLEQEIED